jgi:hypothetical protein
MEDTTRLILEAVYQKCDVNFKTVITALVHYVMESLAVVRIVFTGCDRTHFGDKKDSVD